MPALVDVKSTEQLAVPVVPAGVRTQSSKAMALLSAVKLTLPLGALFVPLAVSVTTAVQVVEPFAWKEDGVQPTVVLVERFVTVTDVLPLLDAWVASPS